MKTKYQRLSIKERKKARNEYYATENGKKTFSKLRLAFIFSIICFAYSIYFVLDSILNHHSKLQTIYGIIIVVISVILIIEYYHIRHIKVNNYLVNKK